MFADFKVIRGIVFLWKFDDCTVGPIPSIQEFGTSKLRFLHTFFCLFLFFSEKVKEELKKDRRAKEQVRITCQPISPCSNKGENNSYTEDFAVYIQFRCISIFSSIYFTTNWVINIVGYTETSWFKSLLYEGSFPCILLLLGWWILFIVTVLRLYRGFT